MTPQNKPQPNPPPVRLCGEVLPHAGHICAFFDSDAEKYEALAPFFGDGIQQGDRIINVVDADVRDRHIKALAHAHVPIRKALESGQMQVLTAEETYLQKGAVDLNGMLELLRETLEAAQRDGSRVRTCGEMNWIGRSSMLSEEVMAYEARVNEFVPTFQCTLVCVYDVAKLPSGMVADILATHPLAIINGRLRPNPVFVEPDAFLAMLQQRKQMLGRSDVPLSS